jgi:hypothetical protein
MGLGNNRSDLKLGLLLSQYASDKVLKMSVVRQLLDVLEIEYLFTCSAYRSIYS